jgi:alpha-mannosidase
MYKISHDHLDSIKRVMNTDNYILRTTNNGLKLLIINNLELKKFTLTDLLEVKDEENYAESLQVLITPSEIVIAAAQNEWVRNNYKSSIKLMKIPIV